MTKLMVPSILIASGGAGHIREDGAMRFYERETVTKSQQPFGSSRHTEIMSNTPNRPSPADLPITRLTDNLHDGRQNVHF